VNQFSRALGNLIAWAIKGFFVAVGALVANAAFAFMNWRHL
jgi:hypothetical protein